MKISVSFLKSNNTYADTIKLINDTSCDYLHVDIMDGLFVPQKNFTPQDLESLLSKNNKPLDIHLMVNSPLDYLDTLTKFHPEYITIHLELEQNIKEIIAKIKKYNIKVGLSIKPETNISKLLPYLSDIDLVLIMAVNPGLGGQSFIPETLNKIKELNKYKDKYYFKTSVDGGINDITISKLLDLNIDIIVSGSYITTQDNYQNQINKLKKNGNHN